MSSRKGGGDARATATRAPPARPDARPAPSRTSVLPAAHRPAARSRRALLLLTCIPRSPALRARAGFLVRSIRKAPLSCPQHLCPALFTATAPRRRARRRRLASGRLARAGRPARASCSPPRYWADLVAEAERGLLDFVTIEDSLGLQSSHARRAGRAHRPGPRPARRGADRGPRRPADPRTSGWCRPRSPPTPSRSTSPRPSPPSTTSAPAGPGVRVQVSARPDEAAHFGRRTLPPLRLDDDTPGRAGLVPSCSTRPPTTSRWCAGCGTAGRTTRRSATSPPAASSTATSCTTSTSRAGTSASRARRSRPRPPQGQPVVTALAHATVAVPAGRPLRRPRLRHPARRRPGRARSSPRSAPSRPRPGRADETAARLRRPGRLPRRRRRPPRPARRDRLDDARRAPRTPATPAIFAGTPAELADLLAGAGRRPG